MMSEALCTPEIRNLSKQGEKLYLQTENVSDWQKEQMMGFRAMIRSSSTVPARNRQHSVGASGTQVGDGSSV